MTYILMFAVLFLVWLPIILHFRKNGTSEENEILTYNEMEKQFFERISEKNKPCKLLNIYFPYDLMLIKSMFLTTQIPYYVEFEHRMSLEPCIHIINCNNTNVYILEEDYRDAIRLIQDYLKTKALINYKVKEKIRNAFELLVLGWVVLSPKSNLGIEVIYRT